MAMIRCPECDQRISDRASYCPHCGNPLETPEPAPAPRENHELFDAGGGTGDAGARRRARKREEWSGRLGCLVVLLILAGLVVGTFYYEKLTLGDYTPRESDAYTFATTNIKNKLKARNFVMFPKVDAVEKSRSAGNTFTFHSEYHTKTAQGEQVSKPFTITVRYIGDGGNSFEDWTVVDMRY